MNPNGRKMVQVTIEDLAEAERRVTVLMGDKVEPRREYIQEYANFNHVDDFDPFGKGSKAWREGKRTIRSSFPSRLCRSPWKRSCTIR